MRFYFDIETIPSQNVLVHDKVFESVQPPANIKKEETMRAWQIEKKPAAVNEALRKTALSGSVGEIISFAFALEDDEPVGFVRRLGDSEGDFLMDVFRYIFEQTDAPGARRRLQWIGYNVLGFDLRFLWQRCVMNRIRPPFPIPYNEKPWAQDKVLDLYHVWSGGQRTEGGYNKLDLIAQLMGYQSKTPDVDGSKIWDLVQTGEYGKILEYNKDDVEKTRFLHKRILMED